MTVEIGDMTVFLAVVREGSFGRAASSMLISQPTVSDRMARLERSLGAQLFTRGARGTALTPAGEQLLPYARRTLGLVDEAIQAVREVHDAPRLRVAVHVTFAHRAVPLVLTCLGQLRRRVTVRDAHSDEIIAMLLDGVVDIGFVLPGAQPRPLRFVALPADPVICVATPSHPLAGRPVSLRSMADYRLALNRWGSGVNDFLAQLDATAVHQSKLTECSDAITALRLARHHDHVAFVPVSIAADELSAGTLIRLNLRPSLRWTIPLALAYRGSDRDDPVVVRLRAAVHQLQQVPRRATRR
jgi:DNA-binding transcriptional LysR family regulator